MLFHSLLSSIYILTSLKSHFRLDLGLSGYYKSNFTNFKFALFFSLLNFFTTLASYLLASTSENTVSQADFIFLSHHLSALIKTNNKQSSMFFSYFTLLVSFLSFPFNSLFHSVSIPHLAKISPINLFNCITTSHFKSLALMDQFATI